ncbi:SusE domain-containing protein [Hymenobacter wooponensis]|uniref:SusF/SusE family outer membrane protein n=1 Tax=Hymenobacter wooponensis TaxID=1525360 RepID=A0A4Z0MR72_9BACT|nr:SusE domain-containing protein [Hymenobacter wooponensis]TGD82362.1 SusF/SusE family outer membrane protein [Hymenobacter wooponensis]
MNSFSTKIMGLALAATVLFSSCEKDETRVKANINATPQLTSSATSATLVRTSATNNAVTYTWTAADFGYPAAVTYALQFAKKGAGFDSNVYEVNVGSALSKTFTVGELNSAFQGADCKSASIPSNMDVRVKATIGATAEPAYSGLGSIAATPYADAPADRWAMIGSATPGGWDRDTYMTYDVCARAYKVTIALKPGAFKFRPNGDWPGNLGDTGGDKMLEADGSDIVAPNEAGTYEVSLNISSTPKPTYTITKK